MQESEEELITNPVPVKNGKFINRTGIKYGKLTVRGLKGKDHRGAYIWVCDCECGNTIPVNGGRLGCGNTKSCGCLHINLGELTRKHGRTETREYIIWCHMKSRCLSPTNKKFNRYGARGISVCERWKDSFENFFADMGVCPKGMSIDRIHNDGNYEPGNCRWATPKQQASNTRRNVFVDHEGEKITVSEFERRMGFPSDFISQRLRFGWSLERAVSTPSQR